MALRKSRLFDPDTCGPRVPKNARRRHLYAADKPSEQTRLSPDGAGLVPGLTDGLPVRVVKPHSAQKARMVSRDLGTVGRAMKRKWFEVAYLELFSGPGYLFDEVKEEELPGSPLQALQIASPFDRYVFSDSSDVCVQALRTRIAALREKSPGTPQADALTGDANDQEHLEQVCSLIDPRSLVIAYLDPAKPNLDFSTVRFLAERFAFLDVIINLPFSGIHRSISAGGVDAPSRMLNHPRPKELLRPDEGGTAHAIREHYDGQLSELGLIHIDHRCVKTTTTNSPLYDIVLASRKKTAVELWQKANRTPVNPQLGLLDFDAGQLLGRHGGRGEPLHSASYIELRE
jgi:three-Cys-motif partner protein